MPVCAVVFRLGACFNDDVVTSDKSGAFVSDDLAPFDLQIMPGFDLHDVAADGGFDGMAAAMFFACGDGGGA